MASSPEIPVWARLSSASYWSWCIETPCAPLYRPIYLTETGAFTSFVNQLRLSLNHAQRTRPARSDDDDPRPYSWLPNVRLIFPPIATRAGVHVTIGRRYARCSQWRSSESNNDLAVPQRSWPGFGQPFRPRRHHGQACRELMT